jgi:hypothetical protein
VNTIFVEEIFSEGGLASIHCPTLLNGLSIFLLKPCQGFFLVIIGQSIYIPMALPLENSSKQVANSSSQHLVNTMQIVEGHGQSLNIDCSYHGLL